MEYNRDNKEVCMNPVNAIAAPQSEEEIAILARFKKEFQLIGPCCINVSDRNF